MQSSPARRDLRAKPGVQPWTCNLCTFHNPAFTSECNTCGVPCTFGRRPLTPSATKSATKHGRIERLVVPASSPTPPPPSTPPTSVSGTPRGTLVGHSWVGERPQGRAAGSRRVLFSLLPADDSRRVRPHHARAPTTPSTHILRASVAPPFDPAARCPRARHFLPLSSGP